MSRRSALLVVICCLATFAFSQDAPRVQVFGGYSFMRANSGIDLSGIDNFNLHGWGAGLSVYFTRNLGLTTDFRGAYGTPNILGIVGINTHLHTFMAGPVVRFPNRSRVTPFFSAVAGGAHIRGEIAGASGSVTNVAWSAGGGLDAHVNRLLDVRVAQLDLLQTRFFGGSQNNLRVSTGIIVKF